MPHLPNIPFDIEWLPKESQHYHGPKNRMRKTIFKHSPPENQRFSQEQVIEYLSIMFPDYLSVIDKIKFYKIFDSSSKSSLHFFIVWCDYSVATREFLFEEREIITAKTGWYPKITGHHVFHHHRPLLDFIEIGLKKARNKSAIEKLVGLGNLLEIKKFSRKKGTSILLKTTSYDIILDAGMYENDLNLVELRSNILTRDNTDTTHR